MKKQGLKGARGTIRALSTDSQEECQAVTQDTGKIREDLCFYAPNDLFLMKRGDDNLCTDLSEDKLISPQDPDCSPRAIQTSAKQKSAHKRNKANISFKQQPQSGSPSQLKLNNFVKQADPNQHLREQQQTIQMFSDVFLESIDAGYKRIICDLDDIQNFGEEESVSSTEHSLEKTNTQKQLGRISNCQQSLKPPHPPKQFTKKLKMISPQHIKFKEKLASSNLQTPVEKKPHPLSHKNLLQLSEGPQVQRNNSSTRNRLIISQAHPLYSTLKEQRGTLHFPSRMPVTPRDRLSESLKKPQKHNGLCSTTARKCQLQASQKHQLIQQTKQWDGPQNSPLPRAEFNKGFMMSDGRSPTILRKQSNEIRKITPLPPQKHVSSPQVALNTYSSIIQTRSSSKKYQMLRQIMEEQKGSLQSSNCINSSRMCSNMPQKRTKDNSERTVDVHKPSQHLFDINNSQNAPKTTAYNTSDLKVGQSRQQMDSNLPYSLSAKTFHKTRNFGQHCTRTAFLSSQINQKERLSFPLSKNSVGHYETQSAFLLVSEFNHLSANRNAHQTSSNPN